MLPISLSSCWTVHAMKNSLTIFVALERAFAQGGSELLQLDVASEPDVVRLFESVDRRLGPIAAPSTSFFSPCASNGEPAIGLDAY